MIQNESRVPKVVMCVCFHWRHVRHNANYVHYAQLGTVMTSPRGQRCMVWRVDLAASDIHIGWGLYDKARGYWDIYIHAKVVRWRLCWINYFSCLKCRFGLTIYRVKYADYSVKWCSGIPCNLYASLDIGLMLALMDGPMSANRRAVGWERRWRWLSRCGGGLGGTREQINAINRALSRRASLCKSGVRDLGWRL